MNATLNWPESWDRRAVYLFVAGRSCERFAYRRARSRPPPTESVKKVTRLLSNDRHLNMNAILVTLSTPFDKVSSRPDAGVNQALVAAGKSSGTGWRLSERALISRAACAHFPSVIPVAMQGGKYAF